MSGIKANKGYRTPNKQGEYARLAKLLPRAIDELEKLLGHPNCNVRLGAINKILDKTLPDLKAVESNFTADKPEKLIIEIVEDKSSLLPLSSNTPLLTT
jgi:hypothetical protein